MVASMIAAMASRTLFMSHSPGQLEASQCGGGSAGQSNDTTDVQAVDHRGGNEDRGTPLLGRLVDDIHCAQLQRNGVVTVGVRSIEKFPRNFLLRCAEDDSCRLLALGLCLPAHRIL